MLLAATNTLEESLLTTHYRLIIPVSSALATILSQRLISA
jgi:hypothetical protein